jgi:hypothetical protein
VRDRRNRIAWHLSYAFAGRLSSLLTGCSQHESMRASRTRLLLLLLSLLVTATCSFSGSWPAPQTASRRVLADRRTGDASRSAGAMRAVLARATALEEDSKAKAHAVEKVCTPLLHAPPVATLFSTHSFLPSLLLLMMCQADVHVAGGTHGEAGSKEQQGAAHVPPPPVPESQRNAFWTAVWRSYLVILFLEIGDRCAERWSSTQQHCCGGLSSSLTCVCFAGRSSSLRSCLPSTRD